mgnify:CR=1 FL=1
MREDWGEGDNRKAQYLSLSLIVSNIALDDNCVDIMKMWEGDSICRVAEKVLSGILHIKG